MHSSSIGDGTNGTVPKLFELIVSNTMFRSRTGGTSIVCTCGAGRERETRILNLGRGTRRRGAAGGEAGGRTDDGTLVFGEGSTGAGARLLSALVLLLSLLVLMVLLPLRPLSLAVFAF